MEQLENYLNGMVQTYNSIREQGLDLYVARFGNSCDGRSILFALPDTERTIDEDGSVTLLDSDMNILEQAFQPVYMDYIRRNSVKIYPFDTPKREENLSLNDLQKIRKEGSSCIFYESPDLC